MLKHTIALPLPPVDDVDLTLAANTGAPVLPGQLDKNKPTHRQKQSQLWLCISFPQLALDVLLQGVKKEVSQLVTEDKSGGVFIHTLNDVAREYGVEKNMSLNAAYALCPSLEHYRRDEKEELLAMQQFADWAQTYTSHVNIASRHKLLLEIKGSLDFFSGMESMLSRIETDLKKQKEITYKMAVTPTPMASQTLVDLMLSGKDAEKIVIEDEKDLRPTLAKVPVNFFLDDQRLLKKLHNTGIKTLQDLWRLPREGLARRFGKSLLMTMDKLIGETSDPRHIHKAALNFEAFIELPIETSSHKIILHGVNRLFDKLVVFLRQHDMGVMKLCVSLKHSHDQTDIIIYLRQMTRTAAHLSELFSEKMERTKLPEKVIEIILHVDEILPFVVVDKTLFHFSDNASTTGSSDSIESDPDWQNTLEQLQNRLGEKAVNYLHARDDIHPEFAWEYHATASLMHQSATPMRPLWLLDPARVLRLDKNIPVYYGHLTFLRGPERIQTGWWREDNEQISRDYYTVYSKKVGYLWIYRDLTNHNRWYLHGFFG